MSGLIRLIEDIAPGVTALECPRCKITYQVEGGEPVENLGVTLRCLECSESGLIPRHGGGARRLREHYPEAFDHDFTPLPNALFDVRVMGRFAAVYKAWPDATDLAILGAIESHCRQHKEWVFAGHATLATEAGCSVSSVKRALTWLRWRGLLDQEERVDHRRRRDPIMQYSLRRFWAALGALASLPDDLGSQGPEVPGTRTSGPWAPNLRSRGTPKKRQEEELEEVPHGQVSRDDLPWETL